jgi:hypothetical protein
MLRFAGRGILIGFAVAVCVTCIKARQAQSPMGLARELQRTLSIVNVAAVRRRGVPQQSRVPVRTVAARPPHGLSDRLNPTDPDTGLHYARSRQV